MLGPAFERAEYDGRLRRVRARMAERGIELLLVSDPANINYLTGYDGWSFYVPQLVAVPAEEQEPVWVGRSMDAAQAPLTSWLQPGNVVGYPEDHVQTSERHPMDWIAGHLAERGWGRRRIGVEMDAYYLSPRALDRLRAGLPGASFGDADLLVNWVRGVKSPAEVACMRDAARIAEGAMRAALAVVRPGARQCDVVAAALAAQVGGDERVSGDLTALSPLIMSGRAAAAPHPPWTADRLRAGEATALELGGACRHYNVGLARTVHLGPPPYRLADAAEAVEEGLEAALEAIRPGALAQDVHAAWQRVLDRHGLRKESRIGYAIGLGYPPDWGEHTISLRPGDRTALRPGNTLHVMLGMWMDGWGLETSETVLVTNAGSECLTRFPRGLQLLE